MKPSTIMFRKVFGYTLVAFLVLYLLVSLYLLFVPRSIFVNRKITQYYNWFLLPGPYFRDDRIRVVPHLTIAYKTPGDDWSVPKNVEQENFVSYHNGIDYGSLKRSRYERYLAKSLNRAAKNMQSVQQKGSFKEIHQYLKYYYLPAEADSVRITYQLESFDNKGNSLDTVFQLKYKFF